MGKCGVGGVVSQIGWMSRRKCGSVEESELIKCLCLRFDLRPEQVNWELDFAEKCGAIRREGTKVIVNPTS